MSSGVQALGPTNRVSSPPDEPIADSPPLSVSSEVMALRSACRALRVATHGSDLRAAAEDRRQAIQDRLESMQRAQEARDDGDFWGSIADVMKVVGAVAAIVVGVAGSVFTGGASGVAAGVLFGLLTATTAAAPYAGECIASAASLSPEATLGLTVGIAALCFAAAVFNPGAAATSTANIATATTKMGSAVAQLAVITQRLGQSIAVLADFTNGYSGSLSGVAEIEQGEATADGQRAAAASVRASQRRDEVRSEIEQTSRESLRAVRQVMQTVAIEEDTMQALVRA